MDLTLEAKCMPSEDVVSRIIEDELIIVPLVSGIGDKDDELYTLNETGRAIWSRLDGQKTLRAIVDELATEFSAPSGEIEAHVIGLMTALVGQKMVVVTNEIKA